MSRQDFVDAERRLFGHWGGPQIGERAAALMPNARVEVVPGKHAPFLDDPERCAALIRQAVST